MGIVPAGFMEHIIYTLAKAFQKKENSRKTKVPRKVWENSIMPRFSWHFAECGSLRTLGVGLRLPSFVFSGFRADLDISRAQKGRSGRIAREGHFA
jgi:hypothetical protein